MPNIATQPGVLVLQVLSIWACLQYAVAIPPPIDLPIPSSQCADSTGQGCRVTLQRAKRASETNPKYRYLYVTQCGIFSEKPLNTPSVEVSATNKTLVIAHEKAARLLFLMLRFMPPALFERLSKKGSAGVFAVDEVVGDFDEYAITKDRPACKGKCTGNCRATCTSTGRKFDSLVGYSRERAVAREDSVLCGEDLFRDPYNKRFNVLSHEFAHNIHLHVLGVDFLRHRMLETSFENRGGVWGQGYATSDLKEFFAEATTSYFRTSLLKEEAAEMNICGTTICTDEFSSRENLKQKDPTLFKLVDELYSGERTFLEGRIGVCDW